jgi:osmotically-inducible protein OsmY
VPRNITLEDEVRATLELDPRIAAPVEVAVSAHNGTVTLRGTVGTFSERHAVVEDVKSISGVNYVVDDIRVSLLGDPRDEEIRGAALQILMDDDALPASGIDVRVENGWVTLTGRVRHQAASDAAFNDVARITGVGGVTNKITVGTE